LVSLCSALKSWIAPHFEEAKAKAKGQRDGNKDCSTDIAYDGLAVDGVGVLGVEVGL
jgi:hypothetical protein